jgi:hypothetical protein
MVLTPEGKTRLHRSAVFREQDAELQRALSKELTATKDQDQSPK